MADVQVLTVQVPAPIQTATVQIPQPITVVSAEASGASAMLMLSSGMSTGICCGGTLGIGANPTQFTIAAGKGLVVDHYTTPGTPVVYVVQWNQLTVDAEIGTGSRHPVYVAIDRTGTVHQQLTPYDVQEYHDWIILGIIGVDPGLGQVVAVYQFGDPSIATHVRLRQLMESLGSFNVEGNVISAHGADLHISRSAGVVHRKAANYGVDPSVADRQTTSAAAIETFFRVYHTGGQWAYSSTLQNTIDPDNYDSGTALTPVPANTPWTIQTVFYSKDARFIQYGQACYSKMEDALSALSAAIQIHPILTTADFILRAYIIVRRGCTALNDPAYATFREAGRFGSGTTALGAGEANTASNGGTEGTGIVIGKVGIDLVFKAIKSADGIVTVTDSPTDGTVAIGLNIEALRAALAE